MEGEWIVWTRRGTGLCEKASRKMAEAIDFLSSHWAVSRNANLQDKLRCFPLFYAVLLCSTILWWTISICVFKPKDLNFSGEKIKLTNSSSPGVCAYDNPLWYIRHRNSLVPDPIFTAADCTSPRSGNVIHPLLVKIGSGNEATGTFVTRPLMVWWGTACSAGASLSGPCAITDRCHRVYGPAQFSVRRTVFPKGIRSPPDPTP